MGRENTKFIRCFQAEHTTDARSRFSPMINARHVASKFEERLGFTMCGICGFTYAEGSEAPVLAAMCDSIAHRGPDGRGMYIANGIALGHTRLALVDIEGGSQPLFRAVGENIFSIVFNGEIYNHTELRKELEALGWEFVTRCDTEVLLVSYLEWGPKCIDKLRGMFAFAVWEKDTGELFCARDPFGIKPFYYTVQGERFIFASESKSILQHPAYEKRVNLDAFSNYLCFQFSPTSETFFAGIQKLAPAHWMRVFPDGRLEMHRYWSPTFCPDAALEHDEAISQIREAVANSVSMHSRADVAVGSLLSGGVDSSYLSSLLAKECETAQTNAQTFTVGFEENKGFYDEVSQASIVAKALGVSNKSKRISETDWWSAVDDVLWHMDEPLGDPAAVALYFVDKLASQSVKAVLSGEGADELFGGYRIYQAPLESQRLRWMPRELLKAAALAAKHARIRGANFLYRALYPPKCWYYTNANTLAFSPSERIAVSRFPTICSSPQSITSHFYNEAEELDEITQMQFLDLNLWLVDDILLKTDKMAMANSLESRVPFLDKEVFKVASILPKDFRVTRAQTKVAFREAASKSLPANTASREKLGFPVPLCEWLRKDASRAKLKHAFESDASKTFFNSSKLIELLDAHIAGANNSRRLWIAYAFLTWHRIYFE